MIKLTKILQEIQVIGRITPKDIGEFFDTDPRGGTLLKYHRHYNIHSLDILKKYGWDNYYNDPKMGKYDFDKWLESLSPKVLTQIYIELKELYL